VKGPLFKQGAMCYPHQTMEVYSLYLHVPFCQRRCSYCDFNTYAGVNYLIPSYFTALAKEIQLVAKSSPDRLKIKTVYFGGGTPSLIPLQYWRQVFHALNENFSVLEDAEISVEMNPGTVHQDLLDQLKKLGINRLSIGMQSAIDEELKLLGRIHQFEEVRNTVTWARDAGFDNINLDLMYGIPKQSLENWQYSLERSLELNPDHLSLYALMLENEVPLQKWIEQGLYPNPDDDLTAEMYDWAGERLEQAGKKQYEISNWAKLDRVGSIRSCKHNLQYWHNLPYLGLGAGAHGYAHGIRTENVNQIEEYIKRMETPDQHEFPRSPANSQTFPIDRWTEIQETMMVGLRLIDEGVSKSAFLKRFGVPFEAYFEKEIRSLIKSGLLEYSTDNQETLRLTKHARFISNQVFMRFVGKKNPEEGKTIKQL
jgi:oxygen-independent coproporphyrinogen III oxidase